MRERVYVFDLDDTLYLERDYVRSGFAHIGAVAQRIYGIEGVGEFAWSLFEDGVRGNTFDLIADRYALPGLVVKTFIEAYRDHAPTITLLPDAEAFLRELPENAAGTALITDGYGAGQRQKIQALGLAEVIDCIIATGDHGSDWTKPSLKAFQAIEANYAGRDVECVYYGDNPAKDFHAPRELGWECVRVRRPMGLYYALDDTITVDATIDRFPERQGRRVQ